MSIIAWLVAGFIVAFIANKIMDKAGAGFTLDLLLGLTGAVIAGFVFTRVGRHDVLEFNLWGAIVSLIGAAIVLAVHHAVSKAPREA